MASRSDESSRGDRSRFWSTVLSSTDTATPESSRDTLPSVRQQSPSPVPSSSSSSPPSFSPITSDGGSESSPSCRDADLAALDTAEVLSSMRFIPPEGAAPVRQDRSLDPMSSSFYQRLGPARTISKPYTCGEAGCSSRFSHISSKYRHYRTVHLGRRDHRCEVPGCGLSFGERSGLTKHTQSVHAKIRKYACSWTGCTLRFSFRLHLQQHVQTVHLKQRPFHCSQCDSRFGQRSSLTRHVRQIHAAGQP